MNRTSKFSVVGLAMMLMSLLAVLLAFAPWRTRNGEWDGYGQAVFHFAWGAVVSVLGAILAIIGLFRGSRTRWTWIAFMVAVCFVSAFCWVLWSLRFH
jgi:hypothetical protein